MGGRPDTICGKLKLLPELHKLGLMPFVREIRVEQSWSISSWFVPQAFSRRDLRYFSAFANVHTMELQRLKIYQFISGVERFSDTSRQRYDPSYCSAHITPPDSCHISSLSFRTWTTSRFMAATHAYPSQPSQTHSSFRSPRRN